MSAGDATGMRESRTELRKVSLGSGFLVKCRVCRASSQTMKSLNRCLLFLSLAMTAAAGTVYPTIDESIAKGDLDDVRLHVTEDPKRLNQGAREKSRPPLEQAVMRNKTEITLYLLEAGAAVDFVNASQRTPLHLAVERNNPVVAAALLKAGVKPDLRDKDGWTALHHAAAKNQVDTAKAILAGGADPMTLSKLGGTPLHEAAASGGAEIIRLLLDHKVDPAVVSKEGVTALDIARQYKNKAAIEELSKPRTVEPEPAKP